MSGGLGPHTPLFVRFVASGMTAVQSISSIIQDERWTYDATDGTESTEPTLPLMVWSTEGWTPLRRVRRLAQSSIGSLFQISTPSSFVEMSDGMPIITNTKHEYTWCKQIAVGTCLQTHHSPFLNVSTFGNRYSRHVHWFEIHDSDVLWTLGVLFVCGRFNTSAFGYTTFEMSHPNTSVLQRCRMILKRMFPSCFFSLHNIGKLDYVLLARGHVMDFAGQMRAMFGPELNRLPFHMLDGCSLIQIAHFTQGIADGLECKCSYPLDVTSEFPKIFLCSNVHIRTENPTMALGISSLLERLGKHVDIEDHLDYFLLTGTTRNRKRNPTAISSIRIVDISGDSCSSMSLSSVSSPSDNSPRNGQRSPLSSSVKPNPDEFVYSLMTDTTSYVAGIGNVVFPVCVNITEVSL